MGNFDEKNDGTQVYLKNFGLKKGCKSTEGGRDR